MGHNEFAQFCSFAAATASDSTSVTCRAIYVGGTGTLVISKDLTTAGVTFTGVPTGTILPIDIEQGRIMAASSATGLIIMS